MRHLFIANDATWHEGREPFAAFWNVAAMLARGGDNQVDMLVPAGCAIGEAPRGMTLHRVAFADRSVEDRSLAARGMSCREAEGAFTGQFPAMAWSIEACALAERLMKAEKFDVLHAPDFEAPLYSLQVKRSCGLGAAGAAPIAIHALRQTEDFAHANDEDIYAPGRVHAWRAERSSCGTADALIVQSRAAGRRLAARHRVPEGALYAIEPAIVPQESLGAGNVIVFAGPLRPASGVFEAAKAFGLVAADFPEAAFEIRGADERYAPLQAKFVSEQVGRYFGAARGRVRVQVEGAAGHAETVLRARVLVVPDREGIALSREAIAGLCAGVPVVVAAIDDVGDDWEVQGLYRGRGVDGIADGIRRAMAGPARIARSHNEHEVLMKWRDACAQIVRAGTARSTSIPACLPFGGRAGHTAPKRGGKSAGSGIAVVVPHFNLADLLPDTLASIRQQTLAPVDVLVVDDGSTQPEAAAVLAQAERDGFRVLRKPNGGLSSARNAGFANVMAHCATPPLGVVFLDADDRIRPLCLERCESVLTARPEVGIVSFWTWHFEAVDWIWTTLSPAMPFQAISNEVCTFSAYRTEAVSEAGGFREEMFLGYEDWDFSNAILAAGWVGVGLPEVLGDYRVRADSMLRGMGAHAHGLMIGKMHDRSRSALALDPAEVLLLSEATQFQLRGELVALRGMVARWRRMAHRPDLAAKWAMDKVVQRLRTKPK